MLRPAAVLAATALLAFGAAACAQEESSDSSSAPTTAAATDTTTAATTVAPESETTIAPPPAGSETTIAPAPAPTPAPPSDQGLGIGSQGDDGGVLVMLHQIVDPVPPGEFLAPDPGTRWVGIDLEVTNTTAEAINVSSLINAELYLSDNTRASATFTDSNLPQLDGSVPPGAALRGTVVFTVPDGQTPARLTYRNSLIGDGINFTLS